MSEFDTTLNPEHHEDTASNALDFLLDLLTGGKHPAMPKNIQGPKVLRQISDGYKFDRADVEIDWRHGRRSLRPAKVDIAMLLKPGVVSR
ncbi:MAG: hypothetical protein IPL36_13345 [Nigerium sp.]|nr:hypothetical protein [Nigerium sp.]